MTQFTTTTPPRIETERKIDGWWAWWSDRRCHYATGATEDEAKAKLTQQEDE